MSSASLLLASAITSGDLEPCFERIIELWREGAQSLTIMYLPMSTAMMATLIVIPGSSYLRVIHVIVIDIVRYNNFINNHNWTENHLPNFISFNGLNLSLTLTSK